MSHDPDKVPSVHEIAERYLGPVRWSLQKGLCRCPGEHLHTGGATGKEDCAVYINGVPTVYCFHDKCQGIIAEINEKIRSAWSLYQPELPKDELEKAREEARKKHAIEAKAHAAKPQILTSFSWPVAQIIKESPTPVADRDWALFLELFDDNDILWVGEPETTGRPWHAIHFRKVSELKLYPTPPHNFTCASCFRRGTISRANENVERTRYMVVEGDQLLGVPETWEQKLANKDACGAVFNWLRSACGLKLRAVVDSGNKSLHGWFDMPPPKVFDELKILLPAIGCDRATFKPSQPVRLPGAVRQLSDGNTAKQHLLYYDGF